MNVRIRLAELDDSSAIELLIAESANALGSADYSRAAIESALKGPWGLDTQLIRDETYFVALIDDDLAACGGWSFRDTLYGSDAEPSRNNRRLDPAVDAARIRAFFVRPQFARQGLGSLILACCEEAALRAGYKSATLGATLPGQRLYTARGYVAGSPVDNDLGNGIVMQVIPMTKRLAVGSDSVKPSLNSRLSNFDSHGSK